MEFFCSQCTKRYKSIAGLKRHKQIAHGKKKPVRKPAPKKASKKGYAANKKVRVKGMTMPEIRQVLIEEMSQLEKDFMTLLQSFGIQYVSQYQIGSKFFDFYLPDYNIIIEVDGDYHHCNPEIYKRPQNATQRRAIKNDHRKNRLCEETGIQILRFWENDIRNRRDLVLAKLFLALNMI
jgi:very-short-patch-repair endonuclease